MGREIVGTSGVGTWGGPGGTAGTATTKDCGLIISDVTNPITREVVESQGISELATQKVTSGIVDPGVTLSGDFQHGRMFEYIMGDVAHANTSADWRHDFSILNNTVSATIKNGNNAATDTVMTTSGCMVERAEISVALNQNLKMSVDWKGKYPASGSVAAAAVLSTLPVFPHALIDVKLNGSTATEVQSASITITKTITRSGGMLSNIYQQGHATDIKFAFTANLGFTDKTFHDLFLAGASGSDIAETADPGGWEFIINASNGVTLGSGRRELKITIENVISPEWNETASVGGLTFIDISGVGTLKECFTVDDIANTAFS